MHDYAVYRLDARLLYPQNAPRAGTDRHLPKRQVKQLAVDAQAQLGALCVPRG
jgi:hypothetical protein